MLSDDLLNWSFAKEEGGNMYLWFWPTAIVQTFVVFITFPLEWAAKKILRINGE